LNLPETDLFVVIPAAGSGSRLGSDLPKSLVTIGSESIVEHTLSAFDSIKGVTSCIVAVPQEHHLKFSSIIAKIKLPFEVLVVIGGNTRQQSVYNSLAFIKQKYCPNLQSRVLIHDSARCLVPVSLIERVIHNLKTSDAITCAVRCVDTLVRSKHNNQISEQILRDNVWAIQTPQAFRFEILMKAHENAHKIDKFDYTDDASLLEGICPVTIVEGLRENIKITWPEDLAFAEKLLIKEID
jgi:2-C-methyl-D-erythritol 4-phosphate cytidylyltransferase